MSTAQQFDSMSDAFDYCREVNRPVTVLVDSEIPGSYKLFPSGRVEFLALCICGSVDNHMNCPAHGGASLKCSCLSNSPVAKWHSSYCPIYQDWKARASQTEHPGGDCER